MSSSPPDLNDAEIRELDDLLDAIPAPLEALDVVMLDGYLCGVLCQPTLIDMAEWLPPACDWNLSDGESGQVLSADTPGWHAAKQERLTALVKRRFDSLAHTFMSQGWFDPLIMEPADENDVPLTGQAAILPALAPWVIGFEHALNHFHGLEELSAPEVPDLLACLWRHLPEKNEEEQAYAKALDEEHPLKTLDAAIEDLVSNVIDLADIARVDRLRVATVRRDAPKIGRNDPCPCGSGRKFKHCHGKQDA